MSELSKIKKEVKILSEFIKNDSEELNFEKPIKINKNAINTIG